MSNTFVYTAIKGNSGYSGAQGSAGTQGTAGAQGTSGYSGVSGNSSPNIQTVTYTNSFSAGQVIYKTSGGYALAQANALSSSDIIGVVQSATGTTFTYIGNGYISGLTGLTDSYHYYLSDTVAGAFTNTVPTAIGSVVKPVLIAIGTTAGNVVSYPGIVNNSNTGTSGYYTKWTSATGLGTGLIQDNGTVVQIFSLSAVNISAVNLVTLNEYFASATNFTTIGTTELSGNTTVVGAFTVVGSISATGTIYGTSSSSVSAISAISVTANVISANNLYVNGFSAVPTNRNAGIALIFGR